MVNGTNGCKVSTTICGTHAHVSTHCPVYGLSRGTYERGYESTQPMTQFAAACANLAQDDHKEEHNA